MRISDWSSDVCSSDLIAASCGAEAAFHRDAAAQPVAAAPCGIVICRAAAYAVRVQRKLAERREIGIAGIEQDRSARPVRTVGARSAAAIGMDAARTRAIAERKAAAPPARRAGEQIGRASCRERVCQSG